MERPNGFFSRRYGADALSSALIAAAGILLLIILLAGGKFLCLLALLPVIWASYRILSTDIPARTAENRAFLGFFGRLRASVRLTCCRFRDRKTHLYFRCACCHRVLRIPRGKGSVTVACPHCRTVSQLDSGEIKEHP